MHARRLSLCLLCLCAWIAPVGAQTITFDEVGNGTNISDVYSGIKFSCDPAPTNPPELSPCKNASIFARAVNVPASTPNSVSPDTGGIGVGVMDHLTGRIQIDLDAPAKSVSIDARTLPLPNQFGNLNEHAYMIAEDTTGHMVGSVIQSSINVFETLTVAAPDPSHHPIRRVYLGESYPNEWAVAQFDNLRLEGTGLQLWAYGKLWWAGIVIMGVIAWAIAALRRRQGKPWW